MTSFLVAAVIAQAVAGQPQVRPETTFPDWVVPAMARLKKEGLLVGYADGFHRATPTRYEFGVATYATLEYVESMLNDTESEIAQRLVRPRVTDYFRLTPTLEADLEILRTWKPHMEVLRRLVDEFARELKSLEVDVPAMKNRVTRCAALVKALPQRVKPFLDVPNGHWAAEAVNELKRAGLLVGYSDGKFKG